MDPKTQYKQMRNEAGKDALKAIAFFFIGLPLIIAAIVFIVMW